MLQSDNNMVPAHEDGATLARAVAGDERALEEALGAAAPRLRARIGPKIGRAYTGLISVEDILQITFLEAFLKITSFDEGRGGGGFLSWLSTIAENNLRDAIRGLTARKRADPRKRVVARTRHESYTDLVGALGATFSTPSAHAAVDEAIDALDRAIGRLPADYARVVREVDLDGTPVDVVAEAMGRSPGAVYMLRARAHDNLAALMGSASRYFSTGKPVRRG